MYHDLGFIRVGAVSPRMKVADVDYNVNEIILLMKQASKKNISILCFPELCITGYTCGDLFLQNTLHRAAENGLKKIIEQNINITAILGMPISVDGSLYNCAVVVTSGKLMGVVPKTYIPNYNEYYEKRWFASGISFPDMIELGSIDVVSGLDLIFSVETKWGKAPFAIEICEDLWSPSPPSGYLAQAGALMIFNPSASTALVTKHSYRKQLLSQQSGRCIAGYIYAGANHDESTTDLVFSGYCGIYENARMLSENQRFKRDAKIVIGEIDLERLKFMRGKNTSFNPRLACRVISIPMDVCEDDEFFRFVDPYPFRPSGIEREIRLEEITHIQTAGLIKRLEYIGIEKVVISVSGGLDSALALMIAAKAFVEMNISKKNIIALTMPGFGTGERTLNNAMALMNELGVTIRTININDAVKQHFKDIGHSGEVHDIAYENSQARERTQIRMDTANMEGALALGTGDLSELALGWATYNGDHMSMYNVNCSIPKTLIKDLVRYMGKTVLTENLDSICDAILNTPITPELIPSKEGSIDQKTEDILGKYDLHDFFLYNMLETGAGAKKLYRLAQIAFKDIADDKEIKDTLRTFIERFFAQQFKRSCMPDGPKVGTVSLSPRGDWRMPSDASSRIWLDELERI